MISESYGIFERNRYFYGKLLTSQDFITEQNYFNNKRQLLNKMLFGSGIVSGMHVVKVDEQSIGVAAGLAFDFLGREIVISEPIVKKLNTVTGFDSIMQNNNGLISTYLCISYNETETEPIHSISKNALSDENDGPEYNKMLEGYSFYITTDCPSDSLNESEQLALKTVQIISGELSVYIVCPRLVRAGETFYVETHIEKGLVNKFVKLCLDMELSFLSHNDSQKVHIQFDEQQGIQEGDIVMRTKLKANDVMHCEGSIKITNVTATVGSKTIKADIAILTTTIIENSGLALMKAMRELQIQEQCTTLCLAKLNIFASPQYYILESVQNLPFLQNALTPITLSALQIHDGFSGQFENQITEQFSKNTVNTPVQTVKSSGKAEVVIPTGAKKGKIYYSVDIPHNLGIGTVFVTAGSVNKDNCIIFEDNGIFQKDFSYSVKVNKETGMFMIGVQLNCDMPVTVLQFCWEASRFTETENSDRKLVLLPNVYYAGLYESVRFDIDFQNVHELHSGELEWTVHPSNGGTITQQGIFTALGTAGFYEIKVKSISEPDLQATAFVVVQ